MSEPNTTQQMANTNRIYTADVKAKSQERNSEISDEKGDLVKEVLSEACLNIIARADQPKTFEWGLSQI